jgi:hypothetical protein
MRTDSSFSVRLNVATRQIYSDNAKKPTFRSWKELASSGYETTRGSCRTYVKLKLKIEMHP